MLVLGCSGGFGLASRITAAFGCGASTLGLSLEKEPTEKKTASAGYYNNLAFDAQASKAGLYARTLNADAFADETREQVASIIAEDLGQIDLLVYSLASPVRPHPRTGTLHRNQIKPIGATDPIRSLNVDKGTVIEAEMESATDDEIADTVAVMGGEDWEFWVQHLAQAGVLANGFRTVAYSYIGSELTWPIYWHGTLGKAKEDLDRAAEENRQRLTALGGDARVAVLKAVVTQASSAIPAVPLYNSLLFKVMKEQGNHESVIAHIHRLFAEQLSEDASQRLDDSGRLRVDNLELDDAIQAEVKKRWDAVNDENLESLGDLAGYRQDFLQIFGFGIEGVDYAAEADPMRID